jgi:hypothetical protein
LRVLSRYYTGLMLLFTLVVICGCVAVSLATAVTEVVDTRRRANLTKDKLTRTRNGELTAPDGVGYQTVVLVFAQGEGFAVDGSVLVGSDIWFGRVAVRDTFALVNGVFKEGDIRFNPADSSSAPIIVSGGSPVLFSGLLSENGYMSGQMQAGGESLCIWETLLRLDTGTS